MPARIDTRRHRAALPVFTPSAVSPDALAMRTVGREAEIELLVRAIRTAATTDNRPHQLIVGPRGSGKSHLLIVALHEALADAEIAERVAVTMLPEDAVEIAGYEDLLVSIVDRAPDGSDRRRDEARGLRSRHDVAGLERLALEQLGDRVMVVVLENLDRVFRDLGDMGQARLRNLTETSAKVLLLASTPLLFAAVSAYARPWYGSFDVEHLSELDAEQGRELLRRVAAAAGDEKLAASLDTPTGLSRVKAVEHLAGGSPRMWTVLAGCMTVDLLDELVPLVEALFDELAPYYQQRLWDLGGVERKLVHELCQVSSATVKDLAHAAGLTERAAATSLGRLHDARWLRRDKRPGTDQRSTWYSLREPLLRHHVEYRDARGDNLPAIVGFLRSWYEAKELAEHLAKVDPTSLAERYVLAAMSGDNEPLRLGAWPLRGTAEHLLTAARCWMSMTQPHGLASFPVGVVAEAVAICVRDGPEAAHRAASARLEAFGDRPASDLARVVDGVLVAIENRRPGLDHWLADAGLCAASTSDAPLADRDRIALGLLGRPFALPPRAPRWFEDHAAMASRLPAGEIRLRLIFESCRAIAERNRDIGGASRRPEVEALRSCAAALGPGDLTTRVLAFPVAAGSAFSRSREEQARVAIAVVEVLRNSRLVRDLDRLLMWVVLRAGGDEDGFFDLEWRTAWVRAGIELRRAGPMRRLLARLDDDPAANALTVVEDMAPRDRTVLACALDLSDRIGWFEPW